ncbi:MAG: multicopper oxidase family protein [Pseudochelatococcus sp.]|jgi:FtsP/CotA-like multicopper oxidase with cupredoxin domain|uniref:multicopper oxidase family protein n=1 Tax=Pseudochelatococcus sp. TaxID=2020869 RepID=UPI003D933AAE
MPPSAGPAAGPAAGSERENKSLRYNGNPLRFNRRALLASLILAPAAGARADTGAGDTHMPPPGPLTLTAGESAHAFDDAQPSVKLWTYNARFPGPLLRVRRGEALALRLHNTLAQPTSLHWYGARLANAADGVAGLTGPALAPGESADIGFTARDAGTFFYRPLVPAHAAEQAERGLTGVLVVDEETPPYADDITLVLDDIALDESGQIRDSFASPAETGLAGRLGNRLLINGRATPERLTRPPGRRLRLRVVNVANARPITLRFDSLVTHIIAADGQPVDAPFPPSRDSVALAPGGRVDAVLDTPADGLSGRVVAALGKDGLPLLVLSGEGAAEADAGAPVTGLPPGDLPESLDLAAARRFDVAIEGGLDPAAPAARAADPARIWRLGGRAWPDTAERPLFRVAAGTPVVLALENRTAFLQVLHLHGHHARRLHALDDGWEPFWLDTIAVPPGQTARIAFLADNPGRWMLGSAVLDRLGAGLAGWFEVG